MILNRVARVVLWLLVLSVILYLACAPSRPANSDTQQACKDRRGEVVVIHGSYDAWFCATPGVGR